MSMMLSFYSPGRRFRIVSVTGSKCDLMCKHCNARFLRHMVSAEEPRTLIEIARDLSSEDGVGMLVSGGSDRHGQVPLRTYYDALREIKDTTDLVLNVHTGLIKPEGIEELSTTGIDIASVDVVGSEDVARKIYGTEIRLSDTEHMFEAFEKHGMNYIPHITSGLDFGRDSGELAALELISRYEPRMVVINALMKTPGSNRNFTTGSDSIASVLRTAQDILPTKIKLGIGCMRPRDIDIPLDIIDKNRVTAIALPSKGLKSRIEKAGITHIEKDGCCALESLE